VAYDDGDKEENVPLGRISFPACPTFVDVVIPKPILEMVTPRMLCMSYEEGVLLNNMEALKEMGVTDAHKKRLLTAVAKAYGKMLFVDGFFQADPHPGNIMVQRQSDGSFKPVLLDFGLAEHIPDHMRFGLAKIYVAANQLSREMFVEGFSQLGPDLDGMRKYEEGDKIKAIWKNSGDWYEAVLLKNNGDGTYKVQFDDDESIEDDVKGRNLTRQGRPDIIREFMRGLTRDSQTKEEAKDTKDEFRANRLQQRRLDAARSKMSKTDKDAAEAWKAERKLNRAKGKQFFGTFQALPKEWIFFSRVTTILRSTATQHDIKVDFRKAFEPFCEIALAEEQGLLEAGGIISTVANPVYKSPRGHGAAVGQGQGQGQGQKAAAAVVKVHTSANTSVSVLAIKEIAPELASSS